MAVKGTEAKEKIKRMILNTFDNSFLYDNEKEIRIPVMENGEEVQIKVTLTCAKVNVNKGDDTAVPMVTLSSNEMQKKTVAESTAPTQEEKDNIANLLKSLGL